MKTLLLTICLVFSIVANGLCDCTVMVDNGNATEVEVEVANGWKATFSGCGAGSTVQSGNQYTHTTAAITENCTVEVICEQRRSPLWLIP